MRWLILLSLAAAIFAQPLAFNAASVKRTPPMDGTNGPIYVGARGGPASGGLITDAYGFQSKGMLDVLVVDHVEKPSGN